MSEFVRSFGVLVCALGVAAVPFVARADESSLPESEAAASAPLNQTSLTIESVEPQVRRSEQAIVIGHNVTPTTSTAPRNTWTVGNYAVGFSPTDSILVATSPWIWASYNTANVHLKWARPVSRRMRVGFFASYFESYALSPFLSVVNSGDVSTRPPTAPTIQPIGATGGNAKSPASSATSAVTPTAYASPSSSATPTTTVPLEIERYQWQSTSVHFLSSYDFSRDVILNLNLHYGYFWNDDLAYSIRMDPGRDSIRGQIDLTTLTQVRLYQSSFHWLFEVGGLGLNYVAPYLQFGNSLAYLSDRWLVQLGASSTVPMGEVWKISGWTPGRYDSRVHIASTGQAYYYRYLQTALHPEVQLQYSF